MESVKRAQASLEFLLLLALAMVGITLIVLVAQQQIGDVIKIKEQNDVRNSLQDISSAAKEVYAQGEGAKKQVYIILPSSYEPNESYVANRTIKMRIRGTDFAAVEDFDVHGSLPGTSGGQWIWVISEGNKVRIGSAMISLSKNSVFLIMDRNSTKSASLSAQSLWDKNISVSTNVLWNNLDVSMNLAPVSFLLTSGQTQTVDIDFTSNDIAAGYYTGQIDFIATDGNNSETVKLPITVEVTAEEVIITTSPPLNVTPDFWGGTFQPGDNTSKIFTVCTNSFTAPASVTFTPSPGTPGSWIGNTSPLGSMSAGSCQDKTLNLSVPNTTAPGTYQGSIDVVGQGVADANDMITLYFVISAAGGGSCQANETGACNCPIGADYWGVPTCNCQPGTIYVINGTVFGGPDNGAPYNGTLRGSPGEDVMVGTNLSDIVYTGTGNDRVCGLEGDDTVYGENGNDVLDGNEGDDLIDGEQGNDIIYGKAGDDTIYGDQGNDEIDGGTGNDIVFAGEGTDLIYGGTGNDELHGEKNNDIICGNADNDALYGEEDDDTIDGGGGADTVDGGAKADTCYRGETVISCESTPPGHLMSCGPS